MKLLVYIVGIFFASLVCSVLGLGGFQTFIVLSFVASVIEYTRKKTNDRKLVSKGLKIECSNCHSINESSNIYCFSCGTILRNEKKERLKTGNGLNSVINDNLEESNDKCIGIETGLYFKNNGEESNNNSDSYNKVSETNNNQDVFREEHMDNSQEKNNENKKNNEREPAIIQNNEDLELLEEVGEEESVIVDDIDIEKAASELAEKKISVEDTVNENYEVKKPADQERVIFLNEEPTIELKEQISISETSKEQKVIVTERPMYCRKCGTKLSLGALFCRKCGTKVEK